jgi:hypothetical protein
MKVVCLALVAGMVVYGVMYGGIMTMYRFAQALSLPPALTNLLPLVFVAVVWFIASRFIKYFQLRAVQTNVPPEGAADERRRQAWLQMKAKGRKRFIWHSGVLRLGLPVFAIFTPVMLFTGPRTHDLTLAENIGLSFFNLLVWLLGGYWYGAKIWRQMEEKYGR